MTLYLRDPSCKLIPSIPTLRVKCSKNPLLTVKRSTQLGGKRMVYILLANKPYKYPNGKRRSRIIYIGTTGKGAGRPATSAVNKASEAFELRGVKTIDVHIVTCGSRKAVKTWLHLEASLLAVFRTRYFDLPIYNRKTGSVRYAEDVTLFRRKALEQILLKFGD
jgi:hypothetical protein